MPLVQYCKKCKTEVPVGENCPYCGGKLAQTTGQISFGQVRKPISEWFEWNNGLRIVLPVLVLVVMIAVAAEAAAGGTNAVIVLLTGGFVTSIAGLFVMLLGAMGLLFVLQGVQNVHVVLDRQGVQVRVYIPASSRLSLYAHFLTVQSAQTLAREDDRPALEGLTLVRRIVLPWNSISRVRIWREGCAVLFFRPTFWQAAAIRVPFSEMEEVETFVRKKLKKKVQPPAAAEKKKKR